MGRYTFTTIEAMDTILRPLLAKHGLAISFAIDRQQGQRDDHRDIERLGLGAVVDVLSAA